MTTTPPSDPAAPAVAPPAVDEVIAALGGLGTPVDTASGGALGLEGPHVVWLVAAGALDLFAVDAAQEGRWHFLGRLEPGSLLLGPVEGPRHTLVGRPSREAVLRRVPLRELARADADTGAVPPYRPDYGAGQPYGLSALEDAFARGVGRGLRTVFEATAGGGESEDASDEGLVWMRVDPGSLAYGAQYGPETAADLLIDPAVWQRMVDHGTRLLLGLDRWIEQRERVHEDRAAAGVRAGEAARGRADETLLASIDRSGTRSGRPVPGTDDATLAVCRLVGSAAGVAVSAPAPGGADGERLDPVERIALASRFRIREVRLTGRWWRQDSGPLVGRRAGSGLPAALLWRRGGYVAVDAAGRRFRVGPDNAGDFEPLAVMFYRPLPERPLAGWRLLRFAVRGTRADGGRMLLGALVSVALGALIPVATGQVLGSFVPAGESGLITQVSLAVVACTVASAAFMLLENVAILRMEGRIEASLQPAVWDRLLRLPARFFAGRSTGELASAAMGVGAIRRVLSGISSTAAQAVTVGTVNFVVLLCFSPALTLVALAMLTAGAAVFLVLGLWQVRWQRRLTVLNNKLNNQAFQTLRGLPKLRVAAAESFAYAAWAGEFARSRELQRRVGRLRNVVTVFNAVYLPTCTLAMFMLLAGPARGTLSPSGFLTFNTSVTMMLTAATQLTGALVSAVSVLPMFEQLRPVLREVPEVAGGSAQPGALTGEIEARGLSFRYGDDGPLVLDDVSFTVAPGEFVAVVGASGCGKSTLLRLLIGFDKPAAGSVLYDGQDLAALDQAAVRRQCGVVLQNAQPFSGSLLEAICGAETYTLEEAWQAAAMAGLAEDIKRMPMGMHTVLSDGGGTVSGGQRQRLMIAQALIRRPRLLFFDEATSALDNETQAIVTRSTRELRASRVVIAHRLSTVMDADRVVVLAAGRVVQQGPPRELLADAGGLFHELVRRQIH
ncbi:NHLP bacteriocin export ABC transporter permease/ATPase subunit [Streptantibioticus silvisoli]|uniref:NHLP bacteriocin export ABC transporter permease/ATPase subunit n=1 Tax=Streptantibioticus silvisoli TaxID=2705255 RepID=A0ABT6W985_9ACTN|nr:NHLP bacteriocin export ABC transporter permease/ATPase subunit [Streptantibioticus silvisoli]MDI5966228.1 NHLP bacteriocin export ABC transporter permease/ATPase subunit [Streptantibioticus silvisoli]